MIGALLLVATGFYAGAAFTTFFVVQGPVWPNRILSALIWPTFPLWPG